MKDNVVVIDPGHGGMDSGAIGNGLMEKNETLEVALEVQHRLSTHYTGVEPFLTRTETHRNMSLDERVKFCNSIHSPEVKLFLSLHFNGHFDEGANGMETFVHPNAPALTRDMRGKIHTEVLNKLQEYDIRDRGRTKEADFQVLRETKAPAILLEPCFLTNPREAELLKSDKFKGALVQGICNGIVRALREIEPLRYRVTLDKPLSADEANGAIRFLQYYGVEAHKEVIHKS